MAAANKPRGAPADPKALAKLRAICLSLPNTKETLTWGAPHFRVGEKIFCGIGDEKGRLVKAFVEESYRLIAPKVTKAPRAPKTPRRR